MGLLTWKRTSTSCIFSIAILGLLLSSCGYTPGEVMPDKYRTIHVYKIFNESQEPEIGGMLKDLLFDQFTRDGRLIPVNDAEKADVLLAIKILSFDKAVSTYTPEQLPDEILLVMEVQMVLQDVGTEKIINTQSIKDKVLFSVITQPVSTEHEAKTELISKIADKILLLSIEGFY